jgi:CRP-like cAMP-binding protein
VDTDSSPTSDLQTGALPERLFPRLTAQQIARIATHGRRRPTAAAEVLVDARDKGIPFFVVLSGEIQAVRAFDGSETLNATLRAGQFSRITHLQIRIVVLDEYWSV